MKKINFKKNNKGFTLVELLIAVVILAAVTIPFVANFALTSKVNQKARNNLRTTGTIQNMMEEMSSVTSKDIILQFENTLINNSLELLPAGATVGNFGELDSTTGTTVVFDKVTNKDITMSQYGVFVSGNSVDIKQSPNNKYCFFAQDVTVGKDKYDMRFTLDGSSYVEPTPGAPGSYYNSDSLAYVAGVNPVYDCAYVDPEGDLRKQCDEFLMRSSKSTTTAGKIKEKLQRELKVVIEDLNTDPNIENIGVSIGRVYTCRDNIELGIANGNNVITIPNAPIYQSAVSKKDPRNIYIYFKGNSSSLSSAVALDIIDIENKTQKEVTVYIIREKIDDPNEDPDFKNNTTMTTELNYAMRVYLKDSGADVSSLYTKICTNAGNDLSKDVTVVQNPDGTKRAYFTVNGGQLDPIKYHKVVKGLDNSTKRDRIFKLKVEVYKPGAVDDGFGSNSKLITSFDGGTYQ